MPNGLSSVPRILTKFLKPVLSTVRKQGHQTMNYLDDFFLVRDNFEECLKAVEDCVDLLSRLGFQINIRNSVFMPTQKIEYLGFTLNSKYMTVTLTKEKKEKLSVLVKQIVNSKMVKIRDIAKILRTFEDALPSIKYGRLHLFFLQKLKNSILRRCLGKYDEFCKQDEGSIKELTWWPNNLNSSNKIDMPNSKFIVFSDACPNG